jgi:hypothetical protein
LKEIMRCLRICSGSHDFLLQTAAIRAQRRRAASSRVRASAAGKEMGCRLSGIRGNSPAAAFEAPLILRLTMSRYAKGKQG